MQNKLEKEVSGGTRSHGRETRLARERITRE